jgi:hypothetical protein
MGSDSLPLLESREPEEVRKWVGRMQLWLESKEVEAGKEMLRAQAGIRVDKIVNWYTLDKDKYRALSFEAWSTELLAYVTPTDWLNNLLDKVSTAQQQPGESVDDYLRALRSDNNRLPLASRLSDERLCAVIRTGLNAHLKARMRLNGTLRTTTTLQELALGLVKLEEVMNLNHAQFRDEASRQARRELQRSQTTTPNAQTRLRTTPVTSNISTNVAPFAPKLSELERKYITAHDGCFKC